VENGMSFHMLSEWYAPQNKTLQAATNSEYTSQIKC